MCNVCNLNGVKIITTDKKTDFNKEVNTIASHTHQTWQKNRSFGETVADTSQGKLAEMVVEAYFSSFLTDFIYIPYDKIRDDNFKFHAPFDAILIKQEMVKDRNLEVIKTRLADIINEGCQTNGKISDGLRNFLLNNNIITIEIKSTKISQKRINLNDSERINAIQKDDYFLYPYFLRTNDNNVTNFKKYVDYACEKYPDEIINVNKNKAKEDNLLNIEFFNSSDIVIRVYTESLSDHNKFYIMGYMRNAEILSNKNIKQFFKKGKSENAIYFTKSIKSGKGIDLLSTDELVWIPYKMDNFRTFFDEKVIEPNTKTIKKDILDEEER